jgi:4-phosphopantoate--beta-alanine ligase
MGKTVISIDLNPLSRTSQRASVPVVDELTRALPNMEKFAGELRADPDEARRIARTFDRIGNRRATLDYLAWRLKGLESRRKRRG